MTRDDILSFLKAHQQEMRRGYGVKRIGLFGSYARQAENEDTDIDIVVEFEADKKNLPNFFGFKRYLEENLGNSVDLGIESALKPIVRNAVKKDIIYV